jgi:hypothetical protein
MYLRANKRIKDGKEHRYWSVEESRRLRSGRVVQRRVLYLGEINEGQQAAWRKTLEVFDEAEQRAASLSLFPEDRAIPVDALDGVQVKCKRTVWAVSTNPEKAGILLSGHFDSVHLENRWTLPIPQ